jgi:Family of unknown function (DUF5302)
MSTDESPEDETKKKFREALERKKAKAADGTSHADGGSKQSKAHGPVEGRREFRRKSG